mgnify:FL=1
MLRELKKNPHRLVGMEIAGENDRLMLHTSQGVTEEISMQALSFSDRYSNGSFVIDTADSGQVEELWIIPSEPMKENETE